MKPSFHFSQRLESRWCLYIVGIIFRIILEYSYRDFVSPIYAYAGFGLVDNPGSYTESWILYLIMLVLLPAKAQKPSDYLICLAFFVFIAPLLVFYGFTDSARWVLYFVLMQYAIMSVMCRGRPFAIRPFKDGPALALGISVFGIIIATILMFLKMGVSRINFDLDAVYNFRREANEELYTGVLGYAVVWATTVCGPFALMLALRGKRYGAAAGVLLLHVFWFGFSSHKSVLFYPALVIALYLLFKYSRALSLLPAALSVIVLSCLVNYYATGALLWSGMLVRRVFFVPSYLTFVYFDYFDASPFVFWSNSFLSPFISYHYDVSVALVIGSYLNDPNLWANNSFFSSGYMQAGVFGVVAYGILAGIALKVLDSLMAKGVQLWMSLSIVIVPFFTLFTSADLTTTLLTHGLGFGMFVLYLMGTDGRTRAKEVADSHPAISSVRKTW